MSVFYKPYLIACTVADGKCGIDAHDGPGHSKSSCRACVRLLLRERSPGIIRRLVVGEGDNFFFNCVI